MDGDDSPWKELSSQGENVTITGDWGAYECGWAQVAPRYDLFAARLASGDYDYYLASTAVSYDLAFAFRIERSTVRLAALQEVASLALRVTHVYRDEEGQSNLPHRPADPLMSKTAPEAVVQR